jgi:hypothetical protein
MIKKMLLEDVKRLKVAELKVELQKRQLATTGNKAELQARLEDHLKEHTTAITTTATTTTSIAEEDPDADVAPPPSSIKLPRDRPAADTLVKSKPPPIVATTTATSKVTTTTPATTKPIINPPTTKLSSPPASSITSNMPTPNPSSTPIQMASTTQLSPEDRLKARMARFQPDTSISNVDQKIVSDADLEAMRRRQQRFGETTRESEQILRRSEQEEKKRKRAERFGVVSEDLLRKRRAERFGMA